MKFMSESSIDIEQLRKSVKRFGYFYPIIVNKEGDIIDGLHRKEADSNWPQKVVDAPTAFEKVLARLHAHYRRKVPQEETAKLFLVIAEELEDRGIPQDKICAEMAKLLPYRDRYIRELLPDEYKRVYTKSELTPNHEQKPEKVVLPSADEYLADYRARHAQPDVEYLSWSLTKNYGVPEREARAMARGRPAYVGQAAKAPAKPSKYEPPQSPTCRCPMCMRDGADKLAILANFVENTVVAQRTLFEFVTEALK